MTKQVIINLMKHKRRSKDIGIEGVAARWYDKNTKRHRLAEMKGYAGEVAGHIQDGSPVLEVAPGPGYLAIELAKLGAFNIVGLDVSRDFVEIAQRNAKEAGVRVEFRHGSASDIPFPDDSFDFVVCTAAFKNFKEPLRALDEMHRVLKPGGAALIVDMDRNAPDQRIEEYTQSIGARGANGFFMKLMFKHFLRNGAYTKDEFAGLVSRTAFEKYEIRDAGIGFHAYLTKPYSR